LKIIVIISSNYLIDCHYRSQNLVCLQYFAQVFKPIPDSRKEHHTHIHTHTQTHTHTEYLSSRWGFLHVASDLRLQLRTNDLMLG